MSLSELNKKIKPHINNAKNDIFIVIVIVLIAIISFGLGRLSKIRENKPPITIENMQANVIKTEEKGGVVGSKNGTKYHFPWCPGALRIKEENKVWFSNKEEAEKAGYTPASNCKGL